MKKILITALFFCSVIVVSFAQSRKEVRQNKIEALRIALITERLDLTPETAQQFWPVYNKYQSERKALKDEYRRSAGSSDVSEAEAEALLSASFELEEKELALKKKYYNQLKSVLSPSQIIQLQKAEREFRERLLRQAKERRKRNRPNGNK